MDERGIVLGQQQHPFHNEIIPITLLLNSPNYQIKANIFSPISFQITKSHSSIYLINYINYRYILVDDNLPKTAKFPVSFLLISQYTDKLIKSFNSSSPKSEREK